MPSCSERTTIFMNESEGERSGVPVRSMFISLVSLVMNEYHGCVGVDLMCSVTGVPRNWCLPAKHVHCTITLLASRLRLSGRTHSAFQYWAMPAYPPFSLTASRSACWQYCVEPANVHSARIAGHWWLQSHPQACAGLTKDENRNRCM